MTVPRPADLIDRERQWRDLVRVWESERPELVVVIGRRRVGKSYALAPFCQAVGGLYYQATRGTEAEQLRSLTRGVGERFQDPALLHGGPFPDWEALFRYVLARLDGAPFLLVLDEFPYLDAAAPALTSILQRLWDHDLRGTRLKIVLSGSHITSMTRLEAADQPLYARRTARVGFEPFEAVELRAFLPGWSPRDRLRAWGAFGGLPGHLALIDPSHDLSANVSACILDPSGRLYDEAQHLLDAFLGEAQVHYAILDAIASGAHTWSGITSRVGKTSGSLSRPMSWLVDMQLVQRVVPLGARDPLRSKRALYRVADPYLRFWHRFVAPLVHAGIARSVTPEDVYRARVAPCFDDYMGPVFEDACRAFVASGRAPFPAFRVGEWWTGDAQVDLVAVAEDGRVLLGECKWGLVGRADLAQLRARAPAVLADLGASGAVTYGLFGAGLGDDEVRRAVDAGEARFFPVEEVAGG